MFNEHYDRGAFDRTTMNDYEVEQYHLPLVEYRPKQGLDLPLSYVLDIEVKAGEVKRLEYFYITMDEELPHFLEWARDKKILAYDLETSDLFPRNGEIATLQFGNVICDDPRVYVIDRRCLSNEGLAHVAALLADPAVMKLGQNIKFECVWSQWHLRNIDIPSRAEPDRQVRFKGLRNVYCTQVTELAIRAGLLSKKGATKPGAGEDRTAYKHSSMASLTRRYLKIEIDKDHDLRTGFFKTPPGEHSLRQIVYAGGDVVYPFYIAQAQKAIVEQRKLGAIIKVEMGLIPVLADAELSGIRMDTRRWRELWQLAVKGRADAERALDDLMLSFQGDLFRGTENANVRPMYYATKKPQPLNYSASAQVKWAIKQYCEQRKWPVHLLTTEAQVLKEKRVWGKEWLDKQLLKGRDVTEEDIPDYVLPEDQYLVLTKADKNTLLLAVCRGQLPPEIVDPLLEYSKHDIRCDTFGNSFLTKHLRADTGCVHTEFHQLVTTTGRLSSSPNCYDGRTQIMTARGWVPFSELRNDDEVAQVTQDTRDISFVRPLDVVRQPYTGPMVRWQSTQVDLLVTPNHRMLVEHRSGKTEVLEATGWVPDRKHFHAGTYAGGESAMTPDEVRFLVALQADGSITPRGSIDFGFRKRRKYARLLELLQKLGMEFTHNATGGRYRVYVNSESAAAAVALLGRNKEWGAWLLALSAPALDAFLDEMPRWDGCLGRGTPYSTNSETNADWVQAVHALRGVRARKRPYTMPSGKTNWQVDVRQVPYSWTTGVQVTEEASDGMIYCVTVPTGFVLVRRETDNGRWVVSVSGNTQNVPNDKRYRRCFIPKPGYVFATVDYSQIEPRITAQQSKDPVYVRTFLDDDDLYLAVAEAMLGYRPDIHSKDPAIKAAAKLERAIFKTVVLALAYGMGASKLRDRLTLALHKEIRAGVIPAPTMDYAFELFNKFFEVHAGVKAQMDLAVKQGNPKSDLRRVIWDDFLEAEVSWVTAPCGRKRFFPPDAYSFHTECPNVGPQAGSATITKAAAVLVQRRIDEVGYDAHVVNLVHDELVYEVRKDQAEEFAADLKALAEQAGQFYCPDIPIKVEYPEGTNGITLYWAKAVEGDEEAEAQAELEAAA